MRRRTQLYLEEDQYRWLKRQAGRGAMADVVRRLIDEARGRTSPSKGDPFIRYLLEEPPGRGGRTTSVATLDEDVYGE